MHVEGAASGLPGALSKQQQQTLAAVCYYCSGTHPPCSAANAGRSRQCPMPHSVVLSVLRWFAWPSMRGLLFRLPSTFLCLLRHSTCWSPGPPCRSLDRTELVTQSFMLICTCIHATGPAVMRSMRGAVKRCSPWRQQLTATPATAAGTQHVCVRCVAGHVLGQFSHATLCLPVAFVCPVG